MQGDLPLLDPAAVRVALAGLADPETDIATLAAIIEDEAALADTSVNKVVAGFTDPTRPARALYFSKAIVPWGPGPHYEHIGLYAYRRAALERFVGLPRGILEQREHLEQLRALEAGMHISVSLIDAARLGVQVDTPADLARARDLAELHPVIPANAGTQGQRAREFMLFITMSRFWRRAFIWAKKLIIKLSILPLYSLFYFLKKFFKK